MHGRVPFAKFYPPIVGILIGMDRSVWLEEHSAVPGHHWRIVDARGSVVGTVTLPANVTFSDVRLKEAWGVSSAEDGLESVVRYRVH